MNKSNVFLARLNKYFSCDTWTYGGNKNEADTSAVEEASVFDYKGI